MEEKTFLEIGEEDDDFSVGMINETDDSLLLRKDNGISLCLRFELEFVIRGGGIEGIGDVVDKVLK